MSTVTDGVEALKPCPFCGKAPDAPFESLGYGVIECVNHECPAQPGISLDLADGNTFKDVVAAWNTRPQPEGVETLVERLRRGASELRDFDSGPPNRLGIADKFDEAAEALARLGGVGDGQK